MGFFNLDGVIEAKKMGKLEKMLEKMSKNDLAILKMELEGYARKVEDITELDAIHDRIEFHLAKK